MVFLAQGDLAGARAVLRSAPKEVDPLELVSYVGTYWDLAWLLDEGQQALMLRLAPSAFDDDRGTWGLVLAQTAALRGDEARSRTYADAARVAFEEQVRTTPDDAQLHMTLGLALAYLGRKADAAREGERGMALAPVAKDGYSGPYYQHLAARIYTLTGDQERALDLLEALLKTPDYPRRRGCGLIPTSIRCGAIRGFSGWWRGVRAGRHHEAPRFFVIFPVEATSRVAVERFGLAANRVYRGS